VRPGLKRLFAIDGMVHEPARLAILTVLDACRDTAFRQLASATGLPDANLSMHLTKLEAAGLIEIVKCFRGRRAHTEVHLSTAGEYAIRQYWKCLDDGRKAADTWRTRTEEPASPSSD
jgi:DNA-binding transcriptional ArsR family regulator